MTQQQVIINPKRLLIIAGSDSGGGAGIQGDIKTAHMHGVYASTAITALTAQNTEGVSGIFDITANFVAEQIGMVLSDIGADVIKIGMLNKSAVISAVHTEIHDKNIPIVLDTVMVAKGGAPLLADNAVSAMKNKLVPLAKIVTPNIPEAEILTGMEIRKMDDMIKAAKALIEMGAEWALVKGGHIKGDAVFDVIVGKKKFEVFSGEKIPSKNTHGTGCTMATAIACNLAYGMDVIPAVEKARDYIRRAILAAPMIGNGHGPVNHFIPV